MKYVLDGQQRITSLYAAIREAIVKNRKYLIYFDLDQKKFVPEIDLEGKVDNGRYVSIAKILDKINHLKTAMTLSSDERKQSFNDVYTAFLEYPFSVIRVADQPIEVVCEIFERVNTKGKKLTVTDLMVAKTWSDNFDLRKKLVQFRKKLEQMSYAEIQDISILQSVSSILVDGCRRKDILELKKDDFIKNWNDCIKAVELAIDFLRNTLRVKISRVLPFSVQIVPLAYFYYKNGFKSPTHEQAKQLANWFWKASLSNRYDSAVEGKIADDLELIQKIVDGAKVHFDYTIILDRDKIVSQKYSLQNAFCLTVMCLYSYKQPKDFKNNSFVDLSKNFSKYNSKEMHHIFPKNYLKKHDPDNKDKADSIANICFIPSALNRDIMDTAPSKYFKDFANQNPHLQETLESHVVGDLDASGITNDDFDTFLKARADLIKQEFEKLISDAQVQVSETGTLDNFA